MTRGVTIGLLGELVVLRGGKALPLPASRKTRALLGYLVATGVPHSRSRLCELLWDGPIDPRAELRWSLSKLRPLVDDAGTERLLADRERVGFEPRGAEVDLLAVRQQVRPAEGRASLADLRRAAARFRGEFLEGLELPDCYRFHEWVIAQREAARVWRVAILAELVVRLAGAPAEALRYSREWVTAEPLDERAHAAVVRALGALGHRREAEQQAESCRRILHRELAVEPSDELAAALRSLPAPAPEPARRASSPAAASSEWEAAPAIQGRRGERRRLEEALSAVASGRPTTILLVGEPGIGKSRLLAHLVERARASGGTVVAGRAFEAERARPYGVWTEALRSLAPETWERVAKTVRRDLELLVPELGPGRPATDQHRLFEGVAKLLRGLGEEAGPAVLVLDDLHWLEDSSVALLHYVVRTAATARLLVAGAARPGELAANATAARLVRTLEREHDLVVLELGPLSAAETAALARSVEGGVDGQRVFAESGGHPLFALEVARALARGEQALPEVLDELIGDRLARVGAHGLALLPWAAALGRSFNDDVLARIVALPAPEVLAGLEELERQHVLRIVSESEGDRDFAHDLVRRGAYRQLSSSRRCLLHRRIAEVLHELDEVEDAWAGDVARHAALAGESSLAAVACRKAGERCLRLLAHDEAADFAERGLQHLSRLPRGEVLRLAFDLLKIYVHATAGRRRSSELIDELERRVAEAQGAALHAQVQTGLYLLSVLHEEQGRPSEAQKHSLRAVEEARTADKVTAVRALANTGRCLAQIERELPRAEALLGEARDLATEIELEVIDIPWGLGLLRAHGGEGETAAFELRRAVEIARREGDHWSESQCLLRLAMIELDRGRPDGTLALCEELRPVAAKLGEGSEGPAAAALEALARRAVGSAAEESLEAALDRLRTIDTKGLIAYAQNVAARQDLAAGRAEAARRRAEEALAAASAVGKASEVALAHSTLARATAAAGGPLLSTPAPTPTVQPVEPPKETPWPS